MGGGHNFSPERTRITALSWDFMKSPFPHFKSNKIHILNLFFIFVRGLPGSFSIHNASAQFSRREKTWRLFS
jgi:hypothetical protein